jgi:hypothetical protein
MGMTTANGPFGHYVTVRRGSQYITGSVGLASGKTMSQVLAFLDDDSISNSTTQNICVGTGTKIGDEDPSSANTTPDTILTPSNTKQSHIVVDVDAGAPGVLAGKKVQIACFGSHEDITDTSVIAGFTEFNSGLTTSNVTVKSKKIKPFANA